MKKQISILVLFTLIIVADSCVKNQQTSLPWHHPLYMANNNYWHQRIPVRIQNNMDRELLGDPVEIQIGRKSGQIPLVGVEAAGVRVVNDKNTELTFRISDMAGNIIEKGPVPEHARITFPLECAINGQTTNFVYYDNPSAWAVGDFFRSHRKIINSGFEEQTSYGPLGWEYDFPDENHLIECSGIDPRSGSRSLKITVKSEGQTNSFGATQHNIHLFDSVNYILEGWVKSENVTGDVRMEIVFGDLNTERFTLGSEKLSAGNGTFDWKKIDLEFTVPGNVTGGRLQAQLEGIGTAWFDDVRLTCKQEYKLITEVLKPEKLNLKERGVSEAWYDDNKNDQLEWQSRASVKTTNINDQPITGKIVCAGIEGIRNRLHNELNENTVLQVTDGTQPVPYYQMGNYVLFNQDIQKYSRHTNYIYFNSDAGPGKNIKVNKFERLNDLGNNLIENPDFDDSDLSGWEYIGGNEDISISKESKVGGGSVQMIIASGESDKETGLEQVIPVHPGKTYCLSTWIKSSDLTEQPDFITGIRGRILGARFLNSENKETGRINRIGINPNDHIDRAWSQLFMIIKAPEDAESVRIQLINSAPGTVWYDDAILIEVINGETSALAIERKAEKDLKELTVWQEDPIVKVFQDDLPHNKFPEVSVSAARNEVEPLQLVVRSPEAYSKMQVKVDPPVDKKGNKLEEIQVGIVDYVPINYPSNYITDRETPFWRQKYPRGRFGSDGWIGMWPDPILPFQEFDLAANSSRPVWIEFTIPKNAVPGEYEGRVQLIHQKEVLKEIPFKVKVRDFTLPDKSHVVAEYDARINDKNFIDARKSEVEIMKGIWKMLADHRLNADAVTPSPVWKAENDKVSFDFTDFDKSASYYFDTLKFNRIYSPWYFYLFGWANLPREKFGEQPYPGEYPYEGVDRSKLRPEFVKAYQSALRLFWNHMKEKGWADKLVLYVSDEPHTQPEITTQMRALCDMVHQVDPNIPIYVSTWWYRPEYAGYVDIWGVSNHGGGWGRPVPVSDLQKIRQGGGRLWFTTDGKMCTDTPYLGFERMLPYFCFKYGAEQYEFWGSNWYTFNPYEYGWHSFIRQSDHPGDLYWIRYPNGDANFIYPGQPIGVDSFVPTIRLKLAREGVEDYEYLHYLDSLITLGKKQGKAISQAEGVLEEAEGLVTIPSAEGRYSTKYLPDPYAVLRSREKVGDAIENLLK